MGRDDRVNVKRELITDLTSRKIISNNKKELKGYEITLRNNKKQKIDIELVDQIPISNNKELVVELEESKGAEYTYENGMLFWRFSLEPGETKKIRFVYSVKYPKDKEIRGL